MTMPEAQAAEAEQIDPEDASPGTGEPIEDDPAEKAKADAAKWRAHAREQEKRAKENAAAARELDKIKRSQMTEIEKAKAEAYELGKAEAMAGIGAERVTSAFRVALASRSDVDVDELLDGIDLSKFQDEAGQADSKRIESWIAKVAPAPKASDKDAEPSQPRQLDMGQGARGGRPKATESKTPQLEAQLRETLGLGR